jgi:hypothetical protein
MKSKNFTPEWQYPSEFRSDGDIYKLFVDRGFPMGRMISGSKSGYREMYPEERPIFNANIIIESRGKIWYGDVSFPADTEEMQELCNQLGEPLYVLREMDARFESENDPVEVLKKKAVVIFKPQNKE